MKLLGAKSQASINNMNNTSSMNNSKDTGYLQSEELMNTGSTPLLQATNLEAHQSDSRLPDYNEERDRQHQTGFIMNMDEEHVPTLDVNKVFDFTGHVDVSKGAIYKQIEGKYHKNDKIVQK